MYRLDAYKTKSGWGWKVTYTKGKSSKVLAKSGHVYKTKAHAVRAFYRLIDCFPKIRGGQPS